MDSIDLNAELWGDAMDEDDDLEQEIQRMERDAENNTRNDDEPAEENDENAGENDENAGQNDEYAEAVDDDALATLRNLKKADSAAKRSLQRLRPKLDEIRLMGELGLPAIMVMMKKQRWRGKGHEARDLANLMRVYEHWGHRMYPRMRFDDIIDKVETLGRKRSLRNFLQKIRLDMPLYSGTTDSVPNSKDDSDEDDNAPGVLSRGHADDGWDDLIAQQETNNTNVHSSYNDNVATPTVTPTATPTATEVTSTATNSQDSTNSQLSQLPEATPSSSEDIQSSSANQDVASTSVLSPDVQARIAANRQRALERLRQKQLGSSFSSSQT